VKKHRIPFSWISFLKRSAIFFVFLQSGMVALSQKQIQTIYPVTDCPRSEKEAEIWYFGDKAGIDFRSGTAVALTDENVMTAFKSPAVISDSMGNLLFFTNAKAVWAKDFTIMSGTPSMLGDLGVTQPCIIVPKPGDSLLYYIFNIDVMTYQPDNTYDTKGLTYCVVDMKGNYYFGSGTSRWNIPLLSPVAQKLTAVRHSNLKDYWIIVHKWGSDEFYSYLLTESGLAAPVVSKAGTPQIGTFVSQSNAYGYMKAAPDGSSLALAISGMNTVELFDFNNNTGVVSNAKKYSYAVPGISPYGIEYSSDSKMLYTSLLMLTGNGPPAVPSRVYQFDLRAGLTNPVLIDSMPGIRIGGLQLARDGRIYASRTVNLLTKKDSIDVIYNPTRPGLDCNYNLLNNVPQSRFSLDGRKSTYGLPSFMQSYFQRPAFTHDSVCKGEVTRFDIVNKANIDNVLWDFGDGSTSAAMSPVHFYPQPGNYKVRLTENFNGKSFKDSVTITIHDLPKIELGDTVLLYSGATVVLHAGTGFRSYEWSTGWTGPDIAVENGGNYWVKVEDQNCCFNSDTVYVNVFKYFFPDAFSPNGDGTNDVFRMIGLYRNINLNLYVYDRWGQLIFQSDNIDNGWDGTYRGAKCPAGTYSWVAFVDFRSSDITTNGKVKFKGTVILVR
jgi:gliding motility-associated-like protein